MVRGVIFLDGTQDFHPGDPPPVGYLDWHEWAQVQTAAGLEQERCCRCSRFKFPQELSSRRIECRYFDNKGAEHTEMCPVCIDCDKEPQ